MQLNPVEFRLYATGEKYQIHVVTQNSGQKLNNFVVKIYPNPVRSKLHFSPKKSVEEIQIYNLEGEKVYQSNSLFKTTVNINVNSFKKGLYLVRLVQKKQTYTSRVLLQ